MRRLFSMLALFVALSAPALGAVDTVPADPAAAALLAKHKAFVGWDVADGSVKTWTATFGRPVTRRKVAQKPQAGASPAPSATPEIDPTVEYRRGLVYRQDYARYASGLHRSDVFTGRMFWRTNLSNNMVHVLEAPAKIDFSMNLVFAEATTLVPIARVRGKAVVDRVATTIVRLSPANGFPIDVYEDDTGAYRRVVVNPEDASENVDIFIDRYALIAPGKKAIAAYRYAQAENATTIAYANVNEQIDDAKLAIPTPTASWTFDPDQGTTPITVSRDSYNNGAGAVIVRATLDGHEGRFLLDSGNASNILLYKPYADAFTANALAKTGSVGVSGGLLRSEAIRIKDLAIGKNVLHNVVADRTGAKSFQDIDGILGFDLFAHAIVDVDLDANTIAFYDPAKTEPTIGKGAYAFPVDLSEFAMRIPVTIGSNVVFHPVIDTGNSFDVLVSENLRSSWKLVVLNNTRNIVGYQVDDKEYMLGVDGVGNIPVSCVRLNSVKVGPYAYTGIHTCFGSAAAFGPDDGLIGFDFLRHFNWTFDYPDEKLVLTPNGK